jgi:hypothetical protein
MTKSRLFQLLATLALAAFFACGRPALAQEKPYHAHVRIVPKSGVHANVVEAKTLKPLFANFGALPPTDGTGADEWPCFSGEPDCTGIAPGGVVIGLPFYTQSLAACDDDSSAYAPCGQILWFYEDDTGNNTSHLIASVVVKQGKEFILDTGPLDFGANQSPAGGLVLVYLDMAFGTLGDPTGPGNGFCAGSTETCVNPVKGEATVTITTTVGTSTIHNTFSMFLE